MNRHIAVLALATTLLASNAYAQNNEPPPNGPVVLNLNGTSIPHTFTPYTTSFTATSTTSNISFAFREDPAFIQLDNVIVSTGGGPNLLINGNFEMGPVGAQAPTGWTYLNTFGATFGGVVTNGFSCGVGNNCYNDGAVQAYDSITQAIATTPGLLYNISFDLSDDGPLLTFLAISNNGGSGTSGNGANLVVYAGEGEPVRAVPLPAALPLFATGLGALGLLGWRRKRKLAAVAA